MASHDHRTGVAKLNPQAIDCLAAAMVDDKQLKASLVQLSRRDPVRIEDVGADPRLFDADLPSKLVRACPMPRVCDKQPAGAPSRAHAADDNPWRAGKVDQVFRIPYALEKVVQPVRPEQKASILSHRFDFRFTGGLGSEIQQPQSMITRRKLARLATKIR
jgi:hypothetical protein